MMKERVMSDERLIRLMKVDDLSHVDIVGHCAHHHSPLSSTFAPMKYVCLQIVSVWSKHVAYAPLLRKVLRLAFGDRLWGLPSRTLTGKQSSWKQ